MKLLSRHEYCDKCENIGNIICHKSKKRNIKKQIEIAVVQFTDAVSCSPVHDLLPNDSVDGSLLVKCTEVKVYTNISGGQVPQSNSRSLILDLISFASGLKTFCCILPWLGTVLEVGDM